MGTDGATFFPVEFPLQRGTEVPYQIQALQFGVQRQLVLLRLLDVFTEQYVVHLLGLPEFSAHQQLVLPFPQEGADITQPESCVPEAPLITEFHRPYRLISTSSP